ncbi:hypothetical protein ECG_03056 [Echinococcus granulosus]|uniref:Uncharacterized protein n=1 Tax=Echinococcus granulosus TaxID=6210 RepID=A0A068WQQ5_ECHGR|nr:hypothetical protein ECG_03056 [Echinococcus granulosus]CDS19976.1 hypothetical protein EgrG_000216100 [Echinococcus granulosus]
MHIIYYQPHSTPSQLMLFSLSLSGGRVDRQTDGGAGQLAGLGKIAEETRHSHSHLPHSPPLNICVCVISRAAVQRWDKISDNSS